jgi:preprotein translocase subunit SecE
MTQKTNQSSVALDTVKWLGTLLLVGSGIATNYFLSGQALLLRVLVIAAFFVSALALSLWTTKGNLFLDFAKEARSEVRKVVWPTRQETMQVTGIVLFVVVVVGLILWGIDAMLLHAIAWLTGLGAN